MHSQLLSFRPGMIVVQPWMCVLVEGKVATGGSSALLKIIYTITAERIYIQREEK